MNRSTDDWVKVFTAKEPYKIEIIKAMLKEQNIEAFEINKKDSAYVTIGEIELYVHKNDQILAQMIINHHAL